MKKLNLVYAFGLLAIASACAELSPEPNQSQPSSTKDVVFTLSLDNKDSKIAIADDGKTTWEINDEIYIHGEYMNMNGYCQTVVLDGTVNTISADKKTATIHITTNDGASENLLPGTVFPYYRSSDYLTTLYAIYPASAAATRNIHCYYYTEFIPSNEPIMVGCDDGNGAFVFKNLCGIISFKISSSLDVDEYIFMGNNGEIVSYSTYGMLYTMKANGTIRHDPADGTIVSTSGAATSVSGSVTNDGTTLHRICIPGGADFTNGFTIVFKKGDEVVKMISTNSHVSVPENGYLSLGDITSHVKDYTAPSSHPATSPALAGATELDDSALEKHANCYIVDGSDSGNNGKTFYFKAYKGNSTTGVGAIHSVEVLWETYNNNSSVSPNSVIAAVDFDKQDANDYYDIVFQMPATLHAGNAVIAARDISGNILWSWHIWIPSTTISTIKDSDVSADTFMDRNLGALTVTVAEETVVSPQSFGMLYQWGRKDPFVGAGAFNSSTKATVAGSANSTTEDTSFNIADSYANPNTFAKFNSWLTGVENWNPTGKSINDPCPAGYRVPDYHSSDLLWGNVLGSALFDASSTYGWWKIGSLVFPLCGYSESGGSISHAYDRSRIIAAQMLDSSHPEHCRAQYIYYESGVLKRTGDNRKRYAGSVRCVVDE